MTQNNMSPYQGDRKNWFKSFLKEKEKQLISELGLKPIKTQKKTFYCEHGKFVYSFVYIKSKEGQLYSPLRDYLGIGKYENMSKDFKHKLIMKASRTTYQKAVEDIKESFDFSLSKKSLNRYVINDAGRLV